MAKKSKSAKKPAKKQERKFKPSFDKIAPVEPRVPETAEKFPTKTLYRCIAENTTRGNRIEHSRRFGPGQIVDLDEEIGKGSKLREHVKRNCFVPIRAGG